MTPEPLESYLSGRWLRGEGVETRLVDPVRGDELATVSAKGLDLQGALDDARTKGQGGLRSLSYAERGKLVGAVADVLTANRARYEDIAIANSGNTKVDAAIDIDGGIGTLKYYARLGAGLGDARMLLDEKPVRLAKAENYQAIHLMVPRRGVAIHINAFNFPSWGLWEKAAVSLVAGVPVLAKPASSTALLAHAMVKDVIAASSAAAPAISSPRSPPMTLSPLPARPIPRRACAAIPTSWPRASRSTSKPTASTRRCWRRARRRAARPSTPSCARSCAR
jgi:3,4-dehydroadipyl-CoA semialdehyde dehydrogenase